jgi:hypothetical protein
VHWPSIVGERIVRPIVSASESGSVEVQFPKSFRIRLIVQWTTRLWSLQMAFDITGQTVGIGWVVLVDSVNKNRGESNAVAEE